MNKNLVLAVVILISTFLVVNITGCALSVKNGFSSSEQKEFDDCIKKNGGDGDAKFICALTMKNLDTMKRLDKVKECIASGQDVNKLLKRPREMKSWGRVEGYIHPLLLNDDKEILTELINAGADVNAITPLRGDYQVMEQYFMVFYKAARISKSVISRQPPI